MIASLQSIDTAQQYFIIHVDLKCSLNTHTNTVLSVLHYNAICGFTNLTSIQLTETSAGRLCLGDTFKGVVTSTCTDSCFLEASGDPHCGTDRGE